MTDERALSQLFHAALDREDVAGPYQRLRFEIEKPGAARRRGRRTIFMTRNRLVLLAAALVLVLGITVVISTHLFFNPASSTINAGPDRTAVAQLLARPLNLPHLAAGDICQDGPYTNDLYGTGPVYGNGQGPTNDDWGSYWDVFFYIPVGQKGPVVARARDLKNGSPVVFLGKYGVGTPYGTDTYRGQKQTQYTAVAFDTEHPPQGVYNLNSPVGSFTRWNLTDGIQKGWTKCFGFQVDGPDFSETFFAID